MNPASSKTKYRGNLAFDKSKIKPTRTAVTLTVTSSQMAFEWVHLLVKLKERSPVLYRKWLATEMPEAHPMFKVRAGEIEPWERQ